MKLATYKDGSRDGQLLVVSRDLASAHYATGIATRLQQLLDDWNFISPQLQDLYDALNAGRTRHAFAFDAARCMAPLPRAYQWVSGSTNESDSNADEPRMAQGGSDDFLGPQDDVAGFDDDVSLDFGSGLAALTGDVRRGASPEDALEGVRLLLLVNEFALRKTTADEDVDLPARPSSAFGPVAVTPDELGAGWRNGRAQLSLHCSLNGKRVGVFDAATGMRFHFGQLIAWVAEARNVRAGSLVGSGAIGSDDASLGYSSIAAKRRLERQQDGAAKTRFLAEGDVLRIEAKAADGHSVFGAIEARITAAVR